MKTIISCAIGVAAITSAGLYAELRNESPTVKFNSEEPTLVEAPSGLRRAASEVIASRADAEVKGIPYLATFQTPAMFNEFTVINVNNDTKSNGVPCTWYHNEELQTARYSYSGENDADDWLISPPIHLEAGNEYKLTVNCKNFKSTYYGDYEEKFEVMLGKENTVESMTKRIMNRKTVRGGKFTDFVNEGISVEESGDYRLGVHCVSDAYRGELDVKYIKLELIPSEVAPGKVGGFSVVADESGKAEAKVSFTAPVKTVGGATLNENLTKLVLNRNGQQLKVYEDVAPGEKIEYTDEMSIPNGNNDYQVIPYTSKGQGEIAEYTVFVGVDVPKAVTNVVYSEPDANTLTVSWDAVEKVGVNGERVNPVTTTYYVFSTATTESGGLSIDKLVGSAIGETTCSFANQNDKGTQERKYWVVVPVTVGGQGTYTMASHYSGTPWPLPFEEHMAETGFNHKTWSYNVSAPKTTILALSEEASDGDNIALAFYATQGNASGYLTAGKIGLSSAKNPVLTFDAKALEGANKISVEVETPAGATTTLEEFTPGADYEKYAVNLKDYVNERYVKFRIVADFKTPGCFLFDNVKVYDMKGKDLGITLIVPSVADYGTETTPVELIISNEGSEPVENFSVRFLYNDMIKGEEVLSEKIGSLDTYTHNTVLPFSFVSNEGNSRVTAEVVLAGDENADNNTSDAKTNVGTNYLPRPADVKMTEIAGGADLSWSEPEGTEGEVEESFEDSRFPAFGIGNLKKGAGSFGNWKVYDGDQMTTYSFQNASIPNKEEPSAWQVFNPSQVSESFLDDWNEYRPYAGKQYMIAWCPNDGSPADNWLISPELSGEEQVLNFMYNAVNTQYGDETFEVLISSTGDSPDDFKLLKRGAATEIEWREFEVDLPEGTKYFAIRHTSEDVFGMMIDAIVYTPRPNILSGYNLYVDGKVVESKKAGETTHSFSGMNNSEMHWYGVSASYDTGESSPVYMLNAAAVAGVDDMFYDGPATLEGVAFDLSGKRVTRDTKGIIIVDGKKILNR